MESDYTNDYDTYYDDEKNIIYSDEDEEEYILDYQDDLTHTDVSNDIFNLPPPAKWSRIKIGKGIYEISSNGLIRPYNSLETSTEGVLVKGTPYRIYKIELSEGIYKNFYMHDLVWFAFNGLPPDGFEVRHKYEYTCKAKKIYVNKLYYLTLVKKVQVENINDYFE